MSTFSMSIEEVSLSEITLKQAMTSLSLLSDKGYQTSCGKKEKILNMYMYT